MKCHIYGLIIDELQALYKIMRSQDEVLDPKYKHQPWARPNRPKSGPDQRDQNLTLGETGKTRDEALSDQSYPKHGPDRTDPRPTLRQTEKTQDRPWARLKRL